MARIYGHLGELVQGRIGVDGPVGLITLPTPTLFMDAECRAGTFALHQPDGVALRSGQAVRLFRRLGVRPNGKWTLRANMPIGEGAGASTAAIMAMARTIMPDVEPGPIALALEGASDPLHIPNAERLLWASREGRVIAHLPPLVRVRIVGGFFGPKRPTDPCDNRFPDISDIIALWPQVCKDPQRMGALVTESTRRTIAMRGGDFTAIRALQARFDAWGVAIAHTGSAAAFLMSIDHDVAPVISTLRGLGWRYVHAYTLG